MPQFKKGAKNIINTERGARARPRRRRGKNPPNRMKIYGNAYGQLKRDVGWLMSVINVEEKHEDSNANGTALSAAWQLVLLNGIAPGTSSTTRVGQSVKITGIEARFTLKIGSAASNTVRVVIFWDKSPNATAPAGTDIYGTGVLTPRVVGNLPRFLILYECRFCLDTLGPGIQADDFQRNLNMHEYFNTGTAGTIADIQEGAIYLMFICDTSATFPTIDYYTRVGFVDN